MPRRIMTSMGVIVATMMLMMAFVGAVPAAANDENDGADHEFADDDFWETWARTDKPVADNTDVPDRTWIWGPEPFTDGIMEEYEDSPGNERLVQYFDKSRMEINDPDAFDDDLWYVTNGLLVVEMVEGRVQVGDEEFEDEGIDPAEVNIAGDPAGEEGMGPTYADISRYGLQDEPAADEGDVITTRVDGEGEMTDDPGMADEDVTAAERVTVEDAEGNVTIDHTVASVFWEFMNSEGTVFIEDEDAEDEGDIVGDGELVTEQLFENAFYATGYPITEAYWMTVMVNAQARDVLWQCFERRCLTYTPSNEEGFAVEAGNVGQHYYRWRYMDEPEPEPEFPTEQLFQATLTGGEEVPAVNTTAEGDAYFLLTDDGESLRFSIELEDIENVTAAHIHDGDAGENGPVLVPLFDADDLQPRDDDDMSDGDDYVVEGEITADALEGMTLWELVEMMTAGDTYVNVHTTQNPGGEIRGQTVVATDIDLEADLSGAEEVPPVETDAAGTATYNYMNDDSDDDPDGGVVTYTLTVENIDNVTGAHIHMGEEGTNGGVVATLFSSETPVTPDAPITGEITVGELVGDLTGASLETLVFEMIVGNTYTNVHSTDYPTGEIRGQNSLTDDDPEPVEPTEFTVQFGSLNGSGVTGTGRLVLDGNDLTVAIDASGLEPNQQHMQHIHGFAECDADDDTVECGLTDVPTGPSTEENAVCPPVTAGGEDGILTLEEGAPFYGNILLPLTFPNGTFPTADSEGNLDYARTFELTDEQIATLGDLTGTVIVLHGMTIDMDGEGGEEAEYDPTLPVACGEVEPAGDDGSDEVETFTADLDELNASDVDGTVTLTLDGNLLTVMVEAVGLEAGQLHPQHIHGFGESETPDQDAVCPTTDLAGDDGILTLEEGLPAYGPVVLPLTPFPSVGEDGTLSWEVSYFIDAEEFGDLTNNVIVLHGMTIDPDGDGEMVAAYDASLPVACGEIEAAD